MPLRDNKVPQQHLKERISQSYAEGSEKRLVLSYIISLDMGLLRLPTPRAGLQNSHLAITNIPMPIFKSFVFLHELPKYKKLKSTLQNKQHK